MRGAAMPKSATSAAVGDAQRRLEQRRASAPPAPRRAGCGSSPAPRGAPGAASIITGRGAPREVREKLGVAGKGEAGAVLQRLLVDRVGAERERLAAADELDAAGDDRDDGGGVAPGRAARGRRAGQRVVQHRQARRPCAAAASAGRVDRRGPAGRGGRRARPCGRGRRSGRRAGRPRSAAQALSAISPPIPAGSPRVSATGGVIARR